MFSLADMLVSSLPNHLLLIFFYISKILGQAFQPLLAMWFA